MLDPRTRPLLAPGLVLAFLAFLPGALATPAPPSADTGPFPAPEAIRPNIVFWTRVFSEWRVGQAVIHDTRHLGLIYEVVELPGPVEASYTDQQKEFLEERRERWRGWLRAIENKVEDGEPLEPAEHVWVEEIAAKAGDGAIAGAHERVRSQRGLRERFRDGLGRSQRYDARIREMFRQAGLPEDLACLPHVESSFDPAARSSAGAVGLWQLTRAAARRFLPVDAAIDSRLDPIASAAGAIGYLADAYAKLGSWPVAVTSYNHGVEGMRRATAQFGPDFERIYREYSGRQFGFASRNFYAEFLAARAIAAEPARFFPEGFVAEPPFDLDHVVLAERATAQELARTHGTSVAELARVNPAWSPGATRGELQLPGGAWLWLPRGAGEVGTSRRHVVQRGDTLSRIASRYGVSLELLLSANELTRASVIQPGQSLSIPVTR